jgi:hypothetical protein
MSLIGAPLGGSSFDGAEGYAGGWSVSGFKAADCCISVVT